MPDAELAAEMHRKAEAIAKAAAEHGSELDFTLESLADLDGLLDRLFARRWPAGRSGRLDSRRYAPMIEPVGAYVGETLRRAAGGEWDAHDEHGPGIRLPGGTWAFPLETSRKRFEDGHASSLAVYAAVMADLARGDD